MLGDKEIKALQVTVLAKRDASPGHELNVGLVGVRHNFHAAPLRPTKRQERPKARVGHCVGNDNRRRASMIIIRIYTRKSFELHLHRSAVCNLDALPTSTRGY